MEEDAGSWCLSLAWGLGRVTGVEEVVEPGRTHALVLVLGSWGQAT